MRSEKQDKNLPLAGVRIADFSWVVAAPYSTQWLAAMGAEVIKVESGRVRDRAQERGTALAGTDRGGSFHHLNNSKRSVTLNLTQPRAQELAKEIILLSDVVIENFAFGVMKRLGLDYDELFELKPELILVSSSGLGRTGPDRDYVAFGMPIQAFSGMTSVTGYENGPPGWTHVAWADPMTGRQLAFSIMAAIYHLRQTGQGQHIDVAMSEAVMAIVPEPFMDYSMNGRVRGPQGSRDDVLAPQGCYPTNVEDTWIALAIETKQQWASLCQLIGLPELNRDTRFIDFEGRQAHQTELDSIISNWTRQKEQTELFTLLQDAGIPAGPSQPFDKVVNDPQVKARDLFFDLDISGEQTPQTVYRVPWRMTPGPATRYYPTPTMGQDNIYVFRDVLGLPEDEIQQLMSDKVIY